MSKQKTYAEKLKDPRWQRIRLKVLERDNFKCVLCNNDQEELQVHHIKYSGEPWTIPLDYLKTLCATCHRGLSFIEKELTFKEFPKKSFRHIEEDTKEEFYGTCYKVSYNYGDLLVNVYFATGFIGFHSKRDVLNYFNLMFE